MAVLYSVLHYRHTCFNNRQSISSVQQSRILRNFFLFFHYCLDSRQSANTTALCDKIIQNKGSTWSLFTCKALFVHCLSAKNITKRSNNSAAMPVYSLQSTIDFTENMSQPKNLP